MLKMELAEVVNPHFAVPVFGVVLCAVLVFAFGFKSSVQPPSFDFDDDKRLKRRKAKRTQTNGHIPSVSNSVATVAKQQVSAAKSSSTGKAQSSKSEESLQAKLRTKKAVASPKAAPAKQEVAKATEPADDVDGWTTAISKKVKKRRNKETPDDASKYDLQDQEMSGGEAKTEDSQEAAQGPSLSEEVVTESPKGQRKRKDKKQKPQKETTKLDAVPIPSTVVEPEPIQTPEPVIQLIEEKVETPKTVEVETPKTVEVETPKTVEVETPKTVEVETPKTVEVETPKTVEVETPQDVAKEEDTCTAEIVPEEAPKRSPRKVRSKRDKIAAAPTIEEPISIPVKAEVKKSKDTVSTEKSKKSPKKKKKGASRSQEVSETVVEKPSVNQEVSSHISTSDITDLSSSKAVQETVAEGATHDSSPPEKVVKSNSTAEEESNPQSSSSPVSFDELGKEDWVEAKPQKKKKKTRREN